LKSGTIGVVKGLDIIKSDDSVSFVMERFKENDTIEPNMIGTERQVFARIYLQCIEFVLLKEKISKFQQILEINDINGENMIIDWMDPSTITNYKLS
jgi:hypothetical protein